MLKPLACLVLAFAFVPPAVAGTLELPDAAGVGDTSRLRDLLNNQRPPEGAPEAPPLRASSLADGLTASGIEELILKSSDCRKDPEDTRRLSAELVGLYSVLNCVDPVQGPIVIVVVPKSVSPAQQLRFPGTADYRVVHGRLISHYLVLELSNQVQYLDLLKTVPGGGFELAGVVQKNQAVRFTDEVIFIDALKSHMTLNATDAGVTSVLSDRVAAAVGSKPRRLDATNTDQGLVVTVKADGRTSSVWP